VNLLITAQFSHQVGLIYATKMAANP